MSDRPEAPQPPDLDLIQRVQRARMQHDRDATPSASAGVYWIESKPQASGQQPTSRAGSFVLLTTLDEVDALWAKVKAATEAGSLGYKSKVATAARTPHDTERCIHVLTYDADDIEDVARVGNAIAALGVQPREYRRVSE